MSSPPSPSQNILITIIFASTTLMADFNSVADLIIIFSIFTIKYSLKQLKCVAYGIEANKFNDFWISTNANPLVCVLSLWGIEWGEGFFHLI